MDRGIHAGAIGTSLQQCSNFGNNNRGNIAEVDGK